PCYGQGRASRAGAEVLRDPSQLARLPPLVPNGFRPGGLTFCRLADWRFLLPAIRKIIPRTPVIGRRININWFSDGRSANSVAFSGHALGINGVISHLQ